MQSNINHRGRGLINNSTLVVVNDCKDLEGQIADVSEIPSPIYDIGKSPVLAKMSQVSKTHIVAK